MKRHEKKLNDSQKQARNCAGVLVCCVYGGVEFGVYVCGVVFRVHVYVVLCVLCWNLLKVVFGVCMCGVVWCARCLVHVWV